MNKAQLIDAMAALSEIIHHLTSLFIGESPKTLAYIRFSAIFEKHSLINQLFKTNCNEQSTIDRRYGSRRWHL